jgi:hypothetical protein
MFLLALAALAAIQFGPGLFARLFAANNTQWISERFSEELREKNELVVFETILTGQETARLEAWLVGTVQEVQIPYSYSISFSVDLSQSVVQSAGDTIEVILPPPRAVFSKLTVDEPNMRKSDWLYPLTPERYADIKAAVEQRLYDECAENPVFLERARATAAEQMHALFFAFAEQAGQSVREEILVIVGGAVAHAPLTDDSVEISRAAESGVF